VIFNIAAAAILHFQKFEILMVCALEKANMRHLVKFHQNRSNGDLTVFKIAAVRHLGFVGRPLGSPAMTTLWSLSLCKIWLKSMQ